MNRDSEAVQQPCSSIKQQTGDGGVLKEAKGTRKRSAAQSNMDDGETQGSSKKNARTEPIVVSPEPKPEMEAQPLSPPEPKRKVAALKVRSWKEVREERLKRIEEGRIAFEIIDDSTPEMKVHRFEEGIPTVTMDTTLGLPDKIVGQYGELVFGDKYFGDRQREPGDDKIYEIDENDNMFPK